MTHIDRIKEIYDGATTHEDWFPAGNLDWDEIVVANIEGHEMMDGDQVRFEFQAGKDKYDPFLAALAPEMASKLLEIAEIVGESDDAETKVKYIKALLEEKGLHHDQ